MNRACHTVACRTVWSVTAFLAIALNASAEQQADSEALAAIVPPRFDDAIADSLADFSDKQGDSGWQYGYKHVEQASAQEVASAEFRQLTRITEGRWAYVISQGPAISARTFEGTSRFIPIRRWSPGAGGSVRLIGSVQKLSPETSAEFRVLVDDREIWSRHFDREDMIRHSFDILTLDLTEDSTVDLLVVGGSRSQWTKVAAWFQIVPEPYTSLWRPDLPTGFPHVTDTERLAQRQMGQAVLQQIRDASASGRKKIVVPPGDYRFHADWHRESTLKNLTDLEIEAHRVTFWFEPPHINALQFVSCRNVTVRGLEIDFTSPIWFQARVTEIDRQAKSIHARLMEGYEPRNARGDLETEGDRTLIFYDSGGRFINHQHSPGKWRIVESGNSVICEDIKRAGIPDALRVHDYIVGTIRTGAALRSKNCAGMRFEDIKIWSSPGVAVREGGGEGGNVYHKVRATRRPHTNRLHAFGADVFHLVGADRGPVLDRCESAYSADDNLNVHGEFGRIVQQIGDRRYYMQGAYEVGDSLEFRDQATVALLGEASIVSVKKTPDGPSRAINDKYSADGEFLVELDQPLELPELTLVVLDGKRSASGFIIRNCWFHSNFQRTLINGSPGGLIENTTLQNVGHGICIQFETWGPWMEGPFASNLVLRNNRFLDAPPSGPAIAVSMHPPGGGTNRRRLEAKPVKNLSITGNYFTRTDDTTVSVHNVDGLKIQGNHVDSESSEWLYLQDCANVMLGRRLGNDRGMRTEE
jgi:hypothetical protein